MGTHEYAYVCDPIGNRTAATNDGVAAAYAANALNQYTNLQSTAYSLQPSYDPDGNMLTNGVWVYTWDAENRLVSACSNNVLLVTNVYDHMSRRIRKEVYAYNDSTSIYEPVTENRFLYDGWNVLAETRYSSTDCDLYFYTWGPDLSGTMQGAGGVGGLLAVTAFTGCNDQPVTCNTFYPAYDANGNIVQYFDTNGVAVASFEYDAFGNTVSTLSNLSTSELSNFPYRFSTKYWDPETGLYYYGYRYYIPPLGRWASRDPIGEIFDTMLYATCCNNCVQRIDDLGLIGLVDSWDWPVDDDNARRQAWYQSAIELGEINSGLDRRLLHHLIFDSGEEFFLTRDEVVNELKPETTLVGNVRFAADVSRAAMRSAVSRRSEKFEAFYELPAGSRTPGTLASFSINGVFDVTVCSQGGPRFYWRASGYVRVDDYWDFDWKLFQYVLGKLGLGKGNQRTWRGQWRTMAGSFIPGRRFSVDSVSVGARQDSKMQHMVFE